MEAAEFVQRWSTSGGSERANYALFLTELCDLLGVAHPEPSLPENARNAYVFDRAVTFTNGDGTTSTGFADLYKRGHFVCETKQGVEKEDEAELFSEKAQTATKKRRAGHGKRGTKAYDTTMLRALGQATQYARALDPAEEGRPPFILVVDVGYRIELYSEFSRTGGAYVPFPDARSHRIQLADLADPKRGPELLDTLRHVWTDPDALDPSRRSAKVTRDIAASLAKLARALEADGHPAEDVAHFLMRCLFTMFAEDVGLLRENAFLDLLKSIDDPAHFAPVMESLWRTMDTGGFSTDLRQTLKRFNGGLFADNKAIPLSRDQLDLMIEAASQKWNDVEPAIFGTLLERALDPVERHKLGAHYTPRAYVERLVVPTVVEPLREEWDAARVAAITLAEEGNAKGAAAELTAFHDRLCDVRVLDPACGSGNFLYVVLEHLKRIEGEVFDAYDQLVGDRQIAFDLSHTVNPEQLLGIELNPRAAAIAELVLWIGYLQWHYRTRGKVDPPEPVIRDLHNIENRDAVLDYDAREEVLDADGEPVTIWDGRTTKPHPVTGLEVPDETARVPMYRYVNPRKAEWPKADFVVGNPPFIGGWMMRQSIGDGYVEALWKVHDLPEKADFVMYWWDKAARLTRAGEVRQFGLITTNSIRQIFQRRVLETHIQAKESPLTLRFAVADHPWVDTATAAAVRIAMTVGATTSGPALIGEPIEPIGNEEAGLATREVACINHQLSAGIDLDSARPLRANDGVCVPGVQLYGSGFVVDSDTANKIRPQTRSEHRVVRSYLNGRDFMQNPRGMYVIDFFEMTAEEAKAANPAAFQRVIDYVKPERDQNRRASIRDKWWRFGWERPVLRQASAGLSRIIATPETAKHRVFAFIDEETLPDNMLTNIASDDAFILGVLSSRVHVVWTLASGGTLEDRPRYTKSVCFEPFPIPVCEGDQKQRIRDLGEQLDAHRKARQAEHPELTMTGMYNVLEKLRSGETLTAKEKTIHEQGLVSVLRQIHDDLDTAVAEAYGWPVDLTDEQILERLVALNYERAEEESRGLVRWLRPDYQNPTGKQQRGVELVDDDEAEDTPKKGAKGKKAAKGAAGKKGAKAPKLAKRPWPKTLAEQAAAVGAVLSASGEPADEKTIASAFTRADKARLAELLATLAAIGKARQLEDGRYVAA
ncbi:class I SAM-dependent DNA methyltransferase [Botrimarina mediterranea]|uniref:site-specific DNA-methyltransferase (adenine-specific) n=1 Tax=Botrimarina mediterranea TaxID=2528022 RepID=A0A518K3Y1_9BACT|nr:DNA methyltransferase [Botrimarina mediterranea]QDV72486.1 hypothetical protein Spa11_06640 [Botrimarina mediterranea]